MKAIIFETWKIRDSSMVDKHDNLIVEWFDYVIEKGKKEGRRIPQHIYYKKTDNSLDRAFLLDFNDETHLRKWMDDVRDDKFAEYMNQWNSLCDETTQSEWTAISIQK
jgi:hypothetical protein